MLTTPALPSPALAFATTIHLGLAVLRNHRSQSAAPISPLALVSFACCALPWFLTSQSGIVVGFGIHGAWFVACEWLLRKPASADIPAPRPARSNVTSMISQASQSTPVARPDRPPVSTPPPRPRNFTQVPILATLDETADIKTIRFARPEEFDFAAGQFVTVRVHVDGKEYARCYSISSAPEVRGYLEISVKRQGLVSNALHASVRPGGMLTVKRPAGAFKYPAGDDRPILLLAGGIGITPLMSMLRHAVATEPSRPVALVYSAHAEADFAFLDELESLARRHPQLRVQLAASHGSTRPCVYPGRVDEGLLRATVPMLAQSVAYICGPAKMIDSMKALLLQLGMPAGQLRHEIFQQAIAASAGLSRDHDASAVALVAGSRSGAAQTATERVAQPAHGAAHWMACSRTGKKVAIGRGQTLLEAAEAGGVTIDTLCRAGVCGTCRVHVSAGDVDCESDTIPMDERSQGFVLACVTTASTDCTVDV